MKNLIRFGIISFAFGLIFITADTVNAQNRREARREYRSEVRDARRDYRRDIRRGESRRSARREYREEVREARRGYRKETGRRVNRGYNVNRNRRIYYRNGRRYVRNY